MASNELEEKINKIRLQNEEIRRRYEEVEADKLNAAKSNALVQLVPSDNWPERKEPPEFSAPPKNVQKQKSIKEHNDRPQIATQQHYSGIQERLGKKDHKFAQGEGPPPDPKYNFLADSEREMRLTDDIKTDEDKNRPRNKGTRGPPKRRGGPGGVGSGSGGSRDAYFKDNRGGHPFHSKEETQPEYDAWRAERNKIDEARINRQKTAEGNWRREWDSNKINMEKDISRKGDSIRKDSSNYDRRNNHHDNDYSNRGYGGSRTYHGSQKNHGHQDYRRQHYEQPHDYKKLSDNKSPLSPTDNRSMNISDKNVKVAVSHGSQNKGPVMSVKVNSPSIAGTGRVGPRQKSRVTYSSQSDADITTYDMSNFSRQKSFDDKAVAGNFNNGQKSAPKSPYSQRKKDGNSKSPYSQRKEFRTDECSIRPKNSKLHPQRNDLKDQRQSNNYVPKQQRVQKRIQKPSIDRIENIDEAIPSEYNPDKSHNYETYISQNDESNNGDNTLDEFNIMNYETSESKDVFTSNMDTVDHEECDNAYENTSYEEATQEKEVNETNDIENNCDEINEDCSNKSTENDKEIMETSVIDFEIKVSEIVEPINDCTDDKEIIVPNENIEIIDSEIRTECTLITELTHDKENGAKLKQMYDIYIDYEESVKEDNVSEENLICNVQKEETTEQQILEKNIVIDESQQIDDNLKIDFNIVEVADNIVNKSIETDTNMTELSMSLNKSENDSGFMDSCISEFIKGDGINKSDENKIHIESEKLQMDSDTLVNLPNIENEKNVKESDDADSVDVTKELCEKTIEICDTHTTLIETSPAFDDCTTTTSDDKQETSEIVKNSTKDIINESTGSTKIIEIQEAKQTETNENSGKEEATNFATEDTKEN